MNHTLRVLILSVAVMACADHDEILDTTTAGETGCQTVTTTCNSEGPDCQVATEECREQLGCNTIGACSIGCSNPVIACFGAGEPEDPPDVGGPFAAAASSSGCVCNGTATRQEPYTIPQCILVGPYCDSNDQCCSGYCDSFHSCALNPPCGNGTCEPQLGENCSSCPSDCGCQGGWTCTPEATCQCVGVVLGECGDATDSCGNTVHLGDCANNATCKDNWCEPLIICDHYDCQGTCNGNVWNDACGVCGGDGTSCCPKDCAGTCYGTAQVDACGVCGGDGTECCQWYDCAGVCNGQAIVDACGVCGGDGSSCSTDYDQCEYWLEIGDYWDYYLHGCGDPEP